MDVPTIAMKAPKHFHNTRVQYLTDLPYWSLDSAHPGTGHTSAMF